jgi:O-acetylserine/cysteine efflux transporter
VVQKLDRLADDSCVQADRRNAFLALAAAGTIWGLTIPFSKLALGWLDPLTLTVARFAVAAPLLSAFATRPALRAAASWRVVLWGAVFYGLGVALQNGAIGLTSVTHAALILGAVPALVALMAAARGRLASTSQSWVGCVIAIAGVGLVAGSGGGSALSGDALMFVSAIASAAYIVAQPGVLAGRDPVAVTVVQMASGALVTLPFAAFADGIPAPVAAGPALWGFAGLAIVGSLLPFALYAYGQARVAPEVAGAFVNLEPLVGAALGAFMFGDPFGSSQLAGTLALLVGIGLSAFSARVGPEPATSG